MDRSESKELIKTIQSRLGHLDTVDLRYIKRTLRFFSREYHDIRDQNSDLKLALAAARFDRDCLLSEKDALKAAHAALGKSATQRDVLEKLIASGIPRDRKIAAIKFVRSHTGWGLREAKEWVEQHYFED